MKIIKQLIATLMILVLLGLSTVGIFGLSSANVDNKKANVALVNEDAGATMDGIEARYGDDFIKLFVQNKDANYEVTTKVSAQNGINEGKYDLMIVVPKTFTEKALTYDATVPERAYLEYAKSNKLSQSETFKADVVSKILKETANKTLIQTFTLNILKTMQKMQENSLSIIDNEMIYQKQYKENIENPMADAIGDFDHKLSEISVQQGMLNTFDSYVKGFDSSVKGQSDKENQNLENFTLQRKKAEETTKVFSQWSTDFEGTLKSMNADTHRQELIKLQTAGALKLQDTIDDLKLNADRMGKYKQNLENNQKQFAKMNGDYEKIIKVDGVYDATTFTGNAKAKENLDQLQRQVDDLVGNQGTFVSQTQEEIDGMKQSFEKKLGETCKLLPKNEEAYPTKKDRELAVGQLIPFCEQMNIKLEKVELNSKEVKYEQIIKLDSETTSVNVLTTAAKARYRFVGETQWQNTLPTSNPTATAIEMEITMPTQRVSVGEVASPLQVDIDVHSASKTVTKNIFISGTIDSEMQEQQRKAQDTITKLEMLTNLYYGKDVKTLYTDLKNEPQGAQFTSFESLRNLTKLNDQALVLKLDKLSDKNRLKKEIMKMLVTTLSKTTDEYSRQLTSYIGEINTVFEDLTGVIAKMEVQKEQLDSASEHLTTLDGQFKQWLEQYNAISGEKVAKIVEMRNDEGKISVNLEENQIQLLSGVADLQKSINNQLEYSQSVIKDSEELKKSSDDSVKKIKENTTKLETTKKEFDKTVEGNSGLVKDFVRKYASAQSGGADNQLFYQNFANPVGITEKSVSNANNLTSFFTILMLSLFALVIARFFNEYRRVFIARKLKSEHGVGNMFGGVTLELGFVAIASVVAAIAVSFIGLQAITDSVNIDKALVYTIVVAALVSLAYAFSAILFGFKKYGTQIILACIALYFLTNGALGIALVKNDSFSWLRSINPLGYIENILQSVFLTQATSVKMLLLVLGAVAIVSIVSIYFLQPLMYKQKQSQ